MSHLPERFLERFGCKIMAAANNFLRFAVAILFVYIGSREFRAIFKRHPMEPGIKAEVPHSRDRRKKSPSVPAAIKFTAIVV